MNKSFKIRIYPNQEQQALIDKTFGHTRYLYNFMLNLKQKLYKFSKLSLRYYDASKILTELKKHKSWLCEVDKCSLQEYLKDLDYAYKNILMVLDSLSLNLNEEKTPIVLIVVYI